MKQKLRRCLAMLLSFTMILAMLPASAAMADDTTGGTSEAASPALLTDLPDAVLHYDMSHADGKLTDVSGHNNHGTLKNFTEDDFVSVNDGYELNFTGKNSRHVEIPATVIKGAGKEAFTIEATYTTDTRSKAWLFTLGTTVASWPNVTNYLFVSPYSAEGGYEGKLFAAIKDGTTEKRYAADTAIIGETDKKNIITVVFDNGNVTYYLNGLQTKTTESGFKIQDILNANSTSTCIGYIGKSLYSSDPYFEGKLLDFKIYETALTKEQVEESHQELAAPLEASAQEKVNAVLDKLQSVMLNGNADKDHIINNISLPTEIDSVSLKWTLPEGTEVIDATGKVTPKDTATKVNVTVEASYNRRGTKTETYELTVIDKEQAEIDALTIPNKDDIRGNITLPEKGLAGSAITWTSSNEAVISPTEKDGKPAGVVTRQDTDTPVKLEATIKQASGDKTKEFNVTVKKKANVGKMTDYMLTYFIGNGTGEEQIYFATSRDGLNWKNLNERKPILESEMGTTGLRDPYIMRSPEGDKFYMIATDLCIDKNGDWTYAQQKGSQAIMVWESTDLVNWTDQRMMTISAGIEAGCTWAPEFFYDDATGEYMVFWASKVKSDNYAKQRLYYCKTRDFYTFTEPQVWIDESHSTIDSTVVRDDDGTYYRFTKNESKTFIYLEKSDSLLGTWTKVNENIAGGVEGPCSFAFNEDDREKAGAKWCLLLDAFGSGGYYPMVTDDLSSGQFTRISANLPPGPRHGTVMNITEAEYKALEQKWGFPSLADDSIPSLVEIGYTLPEQVDVVYAGETSKAAVTWDKTAADFENPGTVTAKATFTVDGKTATETKTIEVMSVSEDLIYYIDSGVGSWNADMPNSIYYDLVGQKVDLRNAVPDQYYKEGSWGIVNSNDENAGNHTSTEKSIYRNGWWAKGGKKCEYIIPLGNGTYKATGYFQEWWGGQNRNVKFYAEYTDASGATKTSKVETKTLGAQYATWKPEIEFEVTGVTGTTDVHFYAEKGSGNNDPVIAGLAIEWKATADEKTAQEAKKKEAKDALSAVTVPTTGDTALEVKVGESQDITINYPDGMADKVKAANLEIVTSFVSSNTKVATVDADGKVRGVAVGDAEITTTIAISSKDSKTFTTKVKVKEVPAVTPVTDVTLDKAKVTLATGKNTTLIATVTPDDASDKTVTWTSSDDNIAKVDQNGKVTAGKKTGTATITVTTKDGEKKATCTVTVVSLSLTKMTLGVKETLTLKVNGAAKGAKITWTPGNKKVADVKNGKVTAKKANAKAVKITAKIDGVTLTCNVTVKAAPKSITLNKKSVTLKKNKTFQIKVKKFAPKNAASYKLTYSIDKKGKKAVSVDKNGKIKAKKKGKATITVTTFNKKKATIKVTVK